MKLHIYRFNWKTIKVYTKSNCTKIISFFKNCMLNKPEVGYLINNDWAKKILESSSQKDSFILNLKDLIENKIGATEDEICIYLDLISKRNFFNFMSSQGKINYLHTYMVDYYDLEKLSRNRLLKVDDKYIRFFYEDDFNEYDILEKLKNG